MAVLYQGSIRCSPRPELARLHRLTVLLRLKARDNHRVLLRE
jgi:hypothetical protein